MSDQSPFKRIPSIQASHRSLIPDPEEEAVDREQAPKAAPTGAEEAQGPESELVELEPVSATPEQITPQATTNVSSVAETGPRELYRALGLAVVSAGVSLAVAPFVSWKAAQLMGPLGNPLIPAGTLIVCGLVLFGVGVVRRALGSIRAEVAYIASEAPRLEQIANHGRELQREFSDVETSLGASRTDAQTLRELVEELMQLATNPEFEVSLFRMAASLDQLGARLDVSMQERFSSMDERLVGIQQDSKNSAEALTSELQSLDTRCVERDAAQQEAQSKLRTQIETSTANLQARLDEGRATLARLGEQTGQLRGTVSQDLSQQLDELRQQFEHHLQSATDNTSTRIEAVSGSVRGLGEELAGAFGQLERSLTSEAEQHLGSLREQLQSNAQGQTGQQLEACLQALLGLSTDIERVQVALETGVGGLSEGAGRAASEVAAGLEVLNSELHQAIGNQSATLASQVESLGTQISERAGEQASNLGEREAAWEASTQRHNEQLKSALADHQGQLEQTFTQRCDALEGELNTLAEAMLNVPAATPAAVEEPVTEQSFVELCTRVQERSISQVPRVESAAPLAAALPFGHEVPSRSETPANASDEPKIPGPLPARGSAQPLEPKLESPSADYPVERLGSEFDDGWIDG